MADFNNIAQQFVTFYYQTFDSARPNLAALYRENSMLTFEADPFQGTEQIVAKLSSLPFQKVQHRVDTTDAQPTASGGIVVMVTGALLVDDQSHPMNYSQIFQLAPEGGSWFIQNDIFRLVYPAAG